ncbi:MAG: aminomethyl-transferring glycine dehydrogenase subunit GcvPB [Micavibrio aeruginosavorus]|uniref:glycine dehydrogenase (aminomethyl-transferring) n=1 Tax=Micavibrio aeruginosavorus TaxID=349221 RepID=A0A2W5A7A6_9BACT|nr:MAG: aminomethyl-transferring glycine dehydrogenase subunit GcvPB [Micavibrio aeruginosavorus]
MTNASLKSPSDTQDVDTFQAADLNRGLHYHENLLWEKQRSDHSGVDMTQPKNTPLRTGQNARGDIGLPQVSEPQVVRHFVRLSTKNYSIDSGFFPLGSCTMKHNPRLNEKMARLPGFAHIHPLQPASTVQGALQLMHELQQWLGELTGLPGVCLTPAAGAHGELAGIMTIARAHQAKGNTHKKVILVPDSAHGTNPATAAMCGFDLRVIPTREGGRVTLDAFKTALGDGHDVAGMMVTNPNTCGLFERDIQEISRLLHDAGGYFYCDGANFNALVGKIRPADFGVDVMHINLHKTFSTPHGGGGPGSGPICVTEELAQYMPKPIVIHNNDTYRLEAETDRPMNCGRIKGFAGQFGMHIRALTYMMSHGSDGLRQVSEDAVLNANYILSQLKQDYHVPFDGPCMHECLLTDKVQKDVGVTTLDIAKALVEHGFHPMTVYFPLVVQGAMLIEPTETESKDALDRFIRVMKKIASDVRNGDVDKFHSYPQSAPTRRLDEVRAAREPKLRWKGQQ